MRRREVISLFKEICECIPDAAYESISLTTLKKSNRSKQEFELRLNVSLNTKNLEEVQSLVSRHRMLAKEDSGSLLIYAAEKPIEMQVFA